MPAMPVSVKITLGLLSFLALSWFLFGVMAAANLITTIPSIQVRLVLGGLGIACSLVTSLTGFLLSRRFRYVYQFSIILLVFIILMSLMDDLGWVDFSLIAITIAALGLLIKDRSWYLKQPDSEKQSS
jgi:hypothetical protein